MSERREWWIDTRYGTTFGAYDSKPDHDDCVHVREVLPGDEPLACQLGDTNLELESVKQRHAKLVEALKAIKKHQEISAGAMHTVSTTWNIAAAALEAEVGDE